jgi:hypothetical protein
MIPSWLEDVFEFYIDFHLCGVYFVLYVGAIQKTFIEYFAFCFSALMFL